MEQTEAEKNRFDELLRQADRKIVQLEEELEENKQIQSELLASLKAVEEKYDDSVKKLLMSKDKIN